jgi:hypothetical protein
MEIRRPARHDVFKAGKIDVTMFEDLDRQHVAEKYRGADENLVNRLGTAISRRRAVLKYREKHHEKLSQGIERILQDQPDTVSTKLSETIATSFDEVGKPHVLEDTASNSGISDTTYATSLLEGCDTITVPRPPKESAGGQPFECPYCFYIITVRNSRSWTHHVFSDLMPYICIFPECSTPNKLYSSCHEWWHHLQDRHSVDDAELDCPLCREKVPGLPVKKHIGRHLVELALFALPRNSDGDSGNSNGSQGLLGDVDEFDDVSVASSNDEVVSVKNDAEPISLAKGSPIVESPRSPVREKLSLEDYQQGGVHFNLVVTKK